MGRWQRWCRWLDSRSSWDSPGVASEATAFLEGRLVEAMQASAAGTAVPPWMWLNAVAHGDEEHIAWLASDTGSSGASGWRRARGRMAAELLACAGGRPGAMRRLQREVMVPIEQSLGGVDDLTPAGMVDIVVAELALAER